MTPLNPLTYTVRQPKQEQLTDEEMRIANALMRVHGSVRAAREESGLHFYIASPEGLRRDGAIELQKQHCAINIDKELGQHKYRNVRRGGRNRRKVALCMKYRLTYTLGELLAMPTLEERGFHPGTTFTQAKVWNFDEMYNEVGQFVPEPPGEVVPVLALPKDHPARWYLETLRGYDIPTLTWQFGVSYCTREYGKGPGEPRVNYQRGSFGFTNTPQGRVVFNGFVGNARVVWQARILEFEHVQDGIVYRACWHPYQNQWVLVQQQVQVPRPDGSIALKWHDLPDDFDFRGEGFKLIGKYKTSRGPARNQAMMGFNAAMEYVARYPGHPRVAVVTEGPLDAGRFGPPAMAILGANLSGPQLDMLARNFDHIILAGQHDETGDDVVAKFRGTMSSIGKKHDVILPPAGIKDFGSLSTAEAMTYLRPFLPPV